MVGRRAEGREESAGAALPGLGHAAHPGGKRWPIAGSLAALDDSPGDRRRITTLLIWYGLEPLVGRDRQRAAALLARCPNPMLCRFIARRMVDADLDGGLTAVLMALSGPGREAYPAFQREVLEGILEAVQGRKRARMPEGWPQVSRATGRSGRLRRTAPGSPRSGCCSATRGPNRACSRSSRIGPGRPMRGRSPCGTWSIAAQPGWPPMLFAPARRPRGCAHPRSGRWRRTTIPPRPGRS